jgi:hypothetical protein
MRRITKKEEYIQEVKRKLGNSGLLFYTDIFIDDVRPTSYEEKVKYQYLMDNNYSIITAKEYRKKVSCTDEIRDYYDNTLFIINFSIIRKFKIEKALKQKAA